MDDDPLAELPAEIRQHITRHKAPPGLERRIRHMLAQQPRRPTLRARWRAALARSLPLAASFACGVLLATAVLLALQPRRADEDALAGQVVTAHVRSLMADHLMDVASTDQHTVKPWFTGKLDFAPPVADLAAAGFPLVGGRLDYLHERAVAALVYRRRGHVINLFVMPAADAKHGGERALARQGFQVMEWQARGMRFWAVSDLNAEDLAQFAHALRAAD